MFLSYIWPVFPLGTYEFFLKASALG